MRALLLTLACLGAVCAHAQLPGGDVPIELDADSTEFDQKNSRMVFTNIHIRQGDLGISARRAESNGLDFLDSRWRFTGDVLIESETARITAEDTQLHFRNHRLYEAQLTGDLVQLVQEPRSRDEITQGRARSMHYDFEHGQIVLEGKAWLSDGVNEVSGDTIRYDIKAERVVADSSAQGDDRVVIIIAPPQNEETNAPAEPPE